MGFFLVARKREVWTLFILLGLDKWQKMDGWMNRWMDEQMDG